VKMNCVMDHFRLCCLQHHRPNMSALLDRRPCCTNACETVISSKKCGHETVEAHRPLPLKHLLISIVDSLVFCLCNTILAHVDIHTGKLSKIFFCHIFTMEWSPLSLGVLFFRIVNQTTREFPDAN
jgi:predicted oxidoreductase